MKIKPVNSQIANQRLREANQAGSTATKTKIVLEEADKAARISNEAIKKPSKHMQKFASAMHKLNIF